MKNDIISNYWLSLHSEKDFFQEIDEKIVDTWVEEKTMGDFIASLTQEEKKVFYSLKIIDCGAEWTENKIDITLKLSEFDQI